MNRLIGLINIAIYFIGQIIFPAIFVWIIGSFSDLKSISQYKQTPNMFILLMLFSNTLLLLILIIINRKYLKRKVSKIEYNLKKTIKIGFIGYLVIIIVNILLGIILTILKINPGEPKNQQIIKSIIDNSTIILSLITIGIITPILEEIIFRMSLMGVLIKDKVSKNWLPYILAAIIFALMHESNIIFNYNADSLALFLSYFGSAMVLGGIYKISKHNLGSTSITHILNNCIAIFIAVVLAS